MAKKRFLILASDSGFGHRKAADSIAKALALRHPDGCEIAVANPLSEETAFWLLKETERSYDRSVRTAPGWFRFTYALFDSRPASALMEQTLILTLFESMRRLIAAFRPDAVVTTTELFNAPAGLALHLLKRRPPLLTVVTDLADVHSLWFNSYPDHFYVASELARGKGLSNGIPLSRMTVSGIPVDPAFCARREPPAELRRRWKLDPHLTTLLFVGSRRVGGILPHLEALEKSSLPVQAAVITGGDDDLLERIRSRPWGFPLAVRPFVNNMPEWMAGADILVTKAGGLILAEGLAAGLPILLIDSLPGQEERNLRYLLSHEAGAAAQDPRALTALLDSWLREDRNLLKRIAENSRRLGKPGAAFTVAEAVFRAGVEARNPEPSARRVWGALE
ncbi:MAG: hypothetical protein JW929_13445 [Anaerolineales bacterium]|nr:hypothetical protein [Anaerolineales bacterium]